MKRKTLGLTAIKLASVAAFAGAPAAALAQFPAYYHAGVWDAFSGRNDNGGAVCGVGYTNPAGNRRLSIRFQIGGTDTVFAASKPDWSIPDNTPVTVVMQIGLNPPWIERANGHGQAIDWPLDQNAVIPFDRQFRGSSSMTLTFPDGNEPSWTISLAGSSLISDTFGRCVRDLTRRVQAQQPPGNGAAMPQGVAPNATQPFNPAAAAPPANALAPLSAPAATQPDGAQPGGTQPNGTQPNGSQPAH